MTTCHYEENFLAYQNDGVCVFRSVLAAPDIRSLLDEVRSIQSRSRVTEVVHRDIGDQGAFRIDILMHKISGVFEQLALDSPVVNLAASYFQDIPFHFFYDQLFFKAPHTSARTQWHQDLPYWPIRGTEVPSYWIALTETDPSKSSVVYIKGSHRSGVQYESVNYEEHKHALSIGRRVCPNFHEMSEYQNEFVSFNLRPGDVVMHHPLVIHGSGPNQSNLPRIAVSLRYCSEETTWRQTMDTMNFPRAEGLSDGTKFKDQNIFVRCK